MSRDKQILMTTRATLALSSASLTYSHLERRARRMRAHSRKSTKTSKPSLKWTIANSKRKVPKQVVKLRERMSK